MDFKFDDIGSFPLPEGITKEWVEENLSSREFEEMCQRAFVMKVKSGVEVPNYPQFRDMVKMFLDLMKDEAFQESPYLIKKENAIIPELESLKKLSYGSGIRICLTGPFEIYLKEFGPVIYEDVLSAISKSIARFAENAIKSSLNVTCISIDDPSLGLNPELQPTPEQMELAYENFDFSVDVQIHLHAPLYYQKFLEIEAIDVIGVESAKDENVMNFIDAEELESYDKMLRIGISRSDIDALIAEFNTKHNVNAWKDRDLIVKAIDELESPEKIYERIEKAYNIFGELIAYVGPDCGLGGFPTQESAVKLLENTAEAISRFKG
ncbi:Methionine synthase II (cobalamin-independent) [Archaeoglobus sulfaticallidus PM70-1]|uniref:Methionine synthase II (Cobalamin-independent) n=1 Tax=Archaeoglobus sulfaticallidus PM70-1 TaxID=387631 RepID=N0BNH6_9EURY|nr:methionine synthase [Archaeoglobus sulfaticallidus]AGK61870.1 Methionine synthase II (cobalamin-independent) [Archaeoglobus sulfaticallidus PM70-1]